MTGELSREQTSCSQPFAAVPGAGQLIDGAYERDSQQIRKL
jgi:hypothetical protein